MTSTAHGHAAALACQCDAPDAIDAAVLAEVPTKETLDAYKTAASRPFDPVAKRAEADILRDGKAFNVAKGAPQVIIDLCAPDEAQRHAITAAVERQGEKGFRTLAVAPTDGDKWRFLGLLPLFDPPRDDSAATIKATRDMGVDIKMVTGDHEAIAKEIAG
jgi:H+-transporting ATPase